MQGRNIILLQMACLEVIVLSLVQLILLVVAEGPIVERLEVLWVQLDCFRVVVNSFLVVAILAVSEASIMVKVSFARL